jgi:hypothetical protein
VLMFVRVLVQYDAVCSWLTVLHFPKAARLALFAQSLSLLSAGGAFYCEDFVALAPLTADEKRLLRNEVVGVISLLWTLLSTFIPGCG